MREAKEFTLEWNDRNNHIDLILMKMGRKSVLPISSKLTALANAYRVANFTKNEVMSQRLLEELVKYKISIALVGKLKRKLGTM